MDHKEKKYSNKWIKKLKKMEMEDFLPRFSNKEMPNNHKDNSNNKRMQKKSDFKLNTNKKRKMKN